MKRTGFWLIVVSLVFAALMLLSAWAIPNHDTRTTVVYLLIAVWWVPYSLLIARSNRCRCVPGDKA